MNMKEWLDRIAPSTNAAAVESGMTTSTLARQLASRDGLPAETVIRIARAYGESAVEALVELGFLAPDEVSRGVDRVDVAAALARATERDLLQEIGKRLDRKDAGPRMDPAKLNVTRSTRKGLSSDAHASKKSR